MSQATPAGWLPDPTGRFEQRYWDGNKWSEHVARAGNPFTDALAEQPAVPIGASAAPVAKNATGAKSGGFGAFVGSVWRGFRRWPTWAQITTAVVVAVIVLAAAVGGGSGNDTKKTASNKGQSKPATPLATTPPTTPAATTRAPTPTTAAPAGFSGSGTFVIGQAVPPGLYVSTGNTLCYWQRATDASGSLGSIIENDNAQGQALVELNAGEVFTTTRCSRWTVYTPPAQPLASVGNGTWAVPSQLTPSRWQSSGGTGCYWARLRNFEGGVNSIAANDNTDGPAVVDIQGSDAAFNTVRCGTWTRVG